MNTIRSCAPKERRHDSCSSSVSAYSDTYRKSVTRIVSGSFQYVVQWYELLVDQLGSFAQTRALVFWGKCCRELEELWSWIWHLCSGCIWWQIWATQAYILLSLAGRKAIEKEKNLHLRCWGKKWCWRCRPACWESWEPYSAQSQVYNVIHWPMSSLNSTNPILEFGNHQSLCKTLLHCSRFCPTVTNMDLWKTHLFVNELNVECRQTHWEGSCWKKES